MRKTISICLLAVCSIGQSELFMKSDVTLGTGNAVMPVDEMHYDIQNKFVVAYAAHPLICNAQTESLSQTLAVKWVDPNFGTSNRNVVPLEMAAAYNFSSKTMTTTANDLSRHVCLTYNQHDIIFESGAEADVVSAYDSETIIELYDSIGDTYIDAIKTGYVINTDLSQGLSAGGSTVLEYEIHVENLLSNTLTGINLIEFVPQNTTLSAYFDTNVSPNTHCEIHTISPQTQTYQFSKNVSCFIGANSDITLEVGEKLVYSVSRQGVLLPAGSASGQLEMMAAVFKRQMGNSGSPDYRSFAGYSSMDLAIEVD